MSLKMSEEDKNSMLDKILPEDEVYKAKVWGTIMAGAKEIAAIGAVGSGINMMLGAALGGGVAGAMGALSNEYCYVGLSDKRLIFSVVGKLDCSKVKGVFDIPLESLTKVKVKSGIIPGRKVLLLYYEGGKIKLSLMSNAIGTNIKNQKENVQIIINELSK